MEGAWSKRPHSGRNAQDPRLEHEIAELAARQHAVVALRQLVAFGLSASAVRGRVAQGRLHRLHHGVYALITPTLLTRSGRFMAAVLACGEDAVLSHRCAAVLHHLGLTARARIDVTTQSSRGRRRPGIQVHDAATLTAADVTVVDHVPTTTWARTLLDVAEDGRRRDLERAIDRAEQERLLDMTAIDDVLARANGRRGAALLQSVLRDHKLGCTLTRNELEEAFLHICRAAGRPPDAVNVWIPFPDGGGAEADFLWRARHLIVEVDGRDVHTTRRAFETDRRRDQRLALLGYRVIRFTWHQVIHEPAYVGATLQALL